MLRDELAFWDRWFDVYPEEVARRLDPRITDPTVLACLSKIEKDHVSLLDVGAGPLTTLGIEAPGKRVNVTAVDALGAAYGSLLEGRGLVPLVQTQQCTGEELLTLFDPESFDLTFAENALDHSADPISIIRNML